jgi:hypothetical protein
MNKIHMNYEDILPLFLAAKPGSDERYKRGNALNAARLVIAVQVRGEMLVNGQVMGYEEWRRVEPPLRADERFPNNIVGSAERVRAVRYAATHNVEYNMYDEKPFR